MVLLSPMVLAGYEDCNIYGNCIEEKINQNITTIGGGVDYNATGLILNWSNIITGGIDYNATGLIQNWNATGLIKNYEFLNLTGLIKDWNWTGYIKDWANEITTHEHDQNLNTTANVTFHNVTSTGWVNASRYITHEGTHSMHFHSVGDNAVLDFDDVGGVNYLELATTGTFFQMYGNPGPANDYLMATITETQGADTELNFYEGGTGHNRFWNSGSGRGGGISSYLCDVFGVTGNDLFGTALFPDCDTATTGADLTYQDDGWFGGRLVTGNGSFYTTVDGYAYAEKQFIGDSADTWSNVSINSSQLYGPIKFDDLNVTGLASFPGDINGTKFLATGIGNRNVVASGYLARQAVFTVNKADNMRTNGSLTAFSCNVYVASGSGDARIHLRKNGVNVMSVIMPSFVATGRLSIIYPAIPRNTITFQEGDLISMYFAKTSGTFSVDVQYCSYEGYYDD